MNKQNIKDKSLSYQKEKYIKIKEFCTNCALSQNQIYNLIIDKDPALYINISIDAQVASEMIFAFIQNINKIKVKDPNIDNYTSVILHIQEQLVHNIDKQQEISIIGIPNFLGFNCYISSVLQVLIRIPEYWISIADTVQLMKINAQWLQQIPEIPSDNINNQWINLIDSRIHSKFKMYYNLLISVYEFGNLMTHNPQQIETKGKQMIQQISNICQSYFNDGSRDVMNSADALFLNIMETIEIFNPIACKYLISSSQKIISNITKNQHFEETYFIPSQIPYYYLFTQHSFIKNIYHQYKFNDVISIIYSGNYQKSYWNEIPLVIGLDSKYKQKFNEEYYLSSVIVYVNGNHYLTYQYQPSNGVWYLLNDNEIADISQFIQTHKDGYQYFEFKQKHVVPTVIVYRKKQKLNQTSAWLSKYANIVPNHPVYSYTLRLNPCKYDLINKQFTQFTHLKEAIQSSQFKTQFNNLLSYIQYKQNNQSVQSNIRSNSIINLWNPLIFPGIVPFDAVHKAAMYDLRNPLNMLLYISDKQCFSVIDQVICLLFKQPQSANLSQYLYEIFGQFYIYFIESIGNIREYSKIYALYQQDQDFQQLQKQAGSDGQAIISKEFIDNISKIMYEHQNFNLPQV